MMTSARIGPGQVVDERYQLVRELGVGGAGQIWLALDREEQQEVALKLLHPRLVAVGAARTRFEREARVLREMDHPHVARLHAVHLEPPRPYFALEYVPGRSLRQEIAVRAETSVHFGPGTLHRIFSQLCQAVQHAHDAGVIHRDLTPANVLLDERVEPFAVKVVDFGIAKILDGDGHDPTTQGRRIGTLAFMAPEQARGEPIDHRTDVFALGVLLFEAITLRRPWYLNADGGPLRAYSDPVTNNVYNTPSELVGRICATQRPAPSEVRPEVGAVFDPIVRRALALDPGDRYAGPNALFEDLDEAIGLNDWTAAVVIHGGIRGDTLARPETTESEDDEPSLQTQVVESDDIQSVSRDDTGPVVLVGIGGPTQLMDSSPAAGIYDPSEDSLDALPSSATRLIEDEPAPARTSILPEVPWPDASFPDIAIPNEPVIATKVSNASKRSPWPLMVMGGVALLAVGYALGRIPETPIEPTEVVQVEPSPRPVLVPRTKVELTPIQAEPQIAEIPTDSTPPVQDPPPPAANKRSRPRKTSASKARKATAAKTARAPSTRALRQLLDKLRADPQERYRSGELGRRIAKAAVAIEDSKTRRSVQRIAETSGFSADLDGLEQALLQLEKAYRANP